MADHLKLIIADFLQGCRTLGTEAAPLYCARDLVERLGLTRGGLMASAWRLPACERKHIILQTSGGPHIHLFITSAGFLRLAMGGRTPESKTFRDKVAGVQLPESLQPVEMALIKSELPKELMALPNDRRKHIVFWLSVVAEIAGSLRRNETIPALARKHHRRGGVSKSSCARYFKLWTESGGDWRAFDRWSSLRKQA